MFMVLHAASAALLHRLGAGDDLPIGAPVAGRSEQGLDDLIGFFVNTVVLRTDVSGNPTFDQLLARVRDTDLAAFSHSDVPFETVVEKVNPARTLARNPLFQVMVGYHSRTPDSAQAAGSALTPVAFEERTAKFDLVFNFTEYLDDERVELRLEYGSDLFEQATAEKIARRQVEVLGAVASDPGLAVGDLDVFLGDERELVVRGFNDTAHPVAEETFYEAFARHVVASPDAVAVVDAAGEVTYAELSARADRIAALLHRRGVSAEGVVGLAVPRSSQMVAVVLGVLKLGAAYLPLDLNHPSDRISYMLADSAARCWSPRWGRARASRTSTASYAFSSTTSPSWRNSGPGSTSRCRRPRGAWTTPRTSSTRRAPPESRRARSSLTTGSPASSPPPNSG